MKRLGFSLEDIFDQERDAALGNGGLGRLAACYLDSSASQAGPLSPLLLTFLIRLPIQELPVWGYGLRYKYGIFQQLISPEGNQLEVKVEKYFLTLHTLMWWPGSGSMAGPPKPMGGVCHRTSCCRPRTYLINQLPRLDVAYDVRFYGRADRLDDGSGRALWTGGQEVLAIAYDVMIPGYKTKTTNNLRLWESKPKRGFDLNSFNGRSMALSIDTTY